jgi:hypothetical protein
MLASPERASDPAIRRALAVHRNTATKAARDALFANYPVVAALVGEDAFAACATAYVEVSPPAEARLCLYGSRFPAFVDAWTPFAEASYLGAVAALERLVTDALFAADEGLLDPEALAAGIDPDAALRWHPATRTGQSQSPAASLWLAHQADAPPEALDTLIWAPEQFLITRPADAIEVRVIGAPTRAFLAGSTLATAAENAASEGGDVAAIFATLLSAGAFAGHIQQGENP